MIRTTNSKARSPGFDSQLCQSLNLYTPPFFPTVKRDNKSIYFVGLFCGFNEILHVEYLEQYIRENSTHVLLPQFMFFQDLIDNITVSNDPIYCPVTVIHFL